MFREVELENIIGMIGHFGVELYGKYHQFLNKNPVWGAVNSDKQKYLDCGKLQQSHPQGQGCLPKMAGP